MSKTPILFDEGTAAHKDSRPLAPASVHDLAAVFTVGGLVLAIAGFADVALFYVTPHFGEAGWEFGTIAQTFDAMPLPMLGLVLLALGARSRQSIPWLRVVSLAFGIVALASLALLVLFVLDIPAALKALRASRDPNGPQAAAIASGLRLTVAKALLLGSGYVVSAGVLGAICGQRSVADR